MSYDLKTLKAIYDRTGGHCHICEKKLAFKNYGKSGARAPWHVEHSNPRALGGSDKLSNLLAACIRCNLKKGTRSTAAARRPHGVHRKPASRADRKQAAENQGWGMLAGGLLGARFGPVGFVVGAFAGHLIGGSGS